MKSTQPKKPSQLRAFFALTKASIISSLRNPTSLFFNFFFPFIFIVIFGMLGQGERNYQVAIRPESLREGPIYEVVSNVEVFKVLLDENNQTIDDKLSKGQLSTAITITRNQAQSQTQDSRGVSPMYFLKIESSAAAPQDAFTISSILDKAVMELNTPADGEIAKLVEVTQISIEGRKYEQIDFILPGQLAFALLTNALFGISFTLVSLKKELVLKRMFATPVSKSTLMLSEVGSRVIIALIQTLVIVLVGHFAFNFTLANGLTTLLSIMILSLFGIITFIAFGIFAASVSKSEESVSPIANIIMMPQLFLSGAFFAIEAFPNFLQPIAKILPMTLINDAYKKVAFEGVALSETMPLIVGLMVWAVAIYIIDAKLFKWEN